MLIVWLGYVTHWICNLLVLYFIINHWNIWISNFFTDISNWQINQRFCCKCYLIFINNFLIFSVLIPIYLLFTLSKAWRTYNFSFAWTSLYPLISLYHIWNQSMRNNLIKNNLSILKRYLLDLFCSLAHLFAISLQFVFKISEKPWSSLNKYVTLSNRIWYW